MPRLALDALKDLARRVLVASRTSPANARVVADALVAADADGIASHGVARLPAYADQARAGKVDGFAEPHLVETAPAVVRVDARSGFAFPAIALGLERAAELVARTGVVAVGVANSHHFGVAGHPVEGMAAKGYVALAFGNSPAGIAPWGGAKAVFGTNPVAFACPRREGPPVVVDLSLSKVARGRIKLAADKGEPIPAGWAVDAEGRPTTDARAAMGGSMLPIGDAKGAALVLMVELLAAALTGSNFGYEASSFFDAEGPPPNVGQFFLVLDPGRLAGERFLSRVEDLVAAIAAQPGTRIPGARRHAMRDRARREGIEIPTALHADLVRRAGG